MSQAVFVGRVVSGDEVVREQLEDGKKVPYVAGYVRFSVQEAFKGIETPEVTIYVTRLGEMCQGDTIAIGKTYVIYANRAESVGRLSVGYCSRTQRIEQAAADLAFLRNLPPEGTGGRLYGQVAVRTGGRDVTPLTGVLVIAEDSTHRRYMNLTDDKGIYEFSGLAPGNYSVKPVLPTGYSLGLWDEQRERTAEVADRSCTDSPFWVEFAGRFRGRVCDETGRPAPAHLKLQSVGAHGRSFSSWTDTGVFEFRSLPPGSYILSLEFTNREYYYPGTSDLAHASVIEVGTPDGAPACEFLLPAKLRVKTICGAVTYPNGQPVQTMLQLNRIRSGSGIDHPETGTVRAETDARGRFVLLGYPGVSYRILVFDPKHVSNPREHEEFVLEDDMDVALVVPESFAENQD